MDFQTKHVFKIFSFFSYMYIANSLDLSSDHNPIIATFNTDVIKFTIITNHGIYIITKWIGLHIGMKLPQT